MLWLTLRNNEVKSQCGITLIVITYFEKKYVNVEVKILPLYILGVVQELH